jgi:hypothetical protein
MTKGEAYKRYYEANKEMICERNRERRKAKAEAPKTPAEIEKIAEERHAKYIRQKTNKNNALVQEAITSVPALKATLLPMINPWIMRTITAKKLKQVLEQMKGEWSGDAPSANPSPNTASPETQNIITAK